MRQDNKMKSVVLMVFHSALPALVIIGLLFLLAGCTRTIHTTLESTAYHTDTLRQTAVRVDSTVIRDSVAVYINGDTVRITQYRDRYRDRLRVDTLYRSVTDTLRMEVPVPVERKLSRWEQARQKVGGIAIGVIVTVVCAAVVWLIRKFRK